MHAGTLSVDAQNALAILGNSGILDNSYLAGGSALALHLGHRYSYDLDFYTRSKIRAEDVVTQFKKLGEFKVSLLEPPHTFMGEFQGIKLSLFRYDYPMIGPLVKFKKIQLASVKDIATMKLSAISGRATKRDYVDLYLITRKFPAELLLKWYEKKFGVLGNNLYVILKAFGYFEDAESDDMPRMIKSVSWEQVKNFFAAESVRLAKKYI